MSHFGIASIPHASRDGVFQFPRDSSANSRQALKWKLASRITFRTGGAGSLRVKVNRTTSVIQQIPKECSCRGLNEHCFRCGGHGFVNEIDNPVPIDGDVSSAKPRFVCPMCATRFEDPTQTERHRTDAHSPLRRFLPEPESGPLTGRDVHVYCVKCKSLIWARLLDRHFEVAHQIPNLSDQAGLTPEQRDQGFVLCSLCRIPVKRKNTERHLLRVHALHD